MADLEAVGREAGLPLWWVQAVAIEYLPCRHFAEDEAWRFDFGLVTDEAVRGALGSCTIVAHGLVFHNVRHDVLRSRMIGRMVSAVPVTPAPDHHDMVPEGEIGPHHIHFMGNPINVWDPKLSFSKHIQVLDDGRLWQWEIARFSVVEGRGFGKWVSDVVDLRWPARHVLGLMACL